MSLEVVPSDCWVSVCPLPPPPSIIAGLSFPISVCQSIILSVGQVWLIFPPTRLIEFGPLNIFTNYESPMKSLLAGPSPNYHIFLESP